MENVMQETRAPKVKKEPRSFKHKTRIINTVVFVLLALGALIMMYPLLWMLMTSVKPYTEVYTGFFPKKWDFSNYKIIWTDMPMARGFLNSFIATVPVVLVQVFVSAMAAFAFAKLHFKGKNALFMIMLGTMMIPFTVIMIPQVIVFRTLKLLNGLLAVTIPKMFGAVMTVFFLRQFLYGIPDSLTEAAKLDGAGYVCTFVRVIFPLVMPAVATQCILSFIGNWNDFLGPLLYIRDPAWQTLPVLLNRYASNNGGSEFIPRLMAASLVSMVPIIIVFVAFQKKIIGSIVFSAVKG